MFMRTDDPVSDFDRWDAEQDKELAKCPLCADCGQPITDYHCYLINDELICEDCLESNYRKRTDDFIDG